jgi:acyl dehydratase
VTRLAVARPSVGDEAPVLRHALSKADVIRYAGASGDSFPLHTDDDYARTAGLDGICAHGMLTAGLLTTAITNWLGVGCLRRYRVRFAALAWPGELLSTRITITGVRGPEIEFSCEVINAQDEVKITGSGTATPTVSPEGEADA